MTTHLMGLDWETACGLDKRTGGVLISTPHKLAVTCDACKATQAFTRAVQRIPLVPTGQYRG